MKRIFKFSFLLLILFSFKNVFALEDDIYITNNNGVGITEERFLELMDAGYTIDDIYNMTQTEYDNANTDNPDIAINTKYYKTTTMTRYGTTSTTTEEVSKNEYDNSSDNTNSNLRASGYVETSYKKLTASIIPSTEYSGKMTYKVYMHWKTMPSVRSHDIISLGFNSTMVTISVGPNFTYLYTVDGYTYTTHSCYMREFTNGAGAVFQLHKDAKTLNQELRFDVNKKDSSKTITELITRGDYAHATETVSATTANNNYSAGMLGITLYSATTNKYDAISEAQVYWDGTW